MKCIAPSCGAPVTVGSPVFCDIHIRAPSGQRGGWLSAYRRKQSMVDQPAMEQVRLDASNIAPRLWMGAKPPFDRDLPKIDILVLAARELQPAKTAFHGALYHCPLVDDHLELTDIARALQCAHSVAAALLAKQSVLVTCSQGRNRSGLITGLALGYITRMTADQIIDHIRRRRTTSGVLSNQAFVEHLRKYIDGDRRKKF